MILLINNHDLRIVDMDCSEKLNSDYLSMTELTKEIGSIVQKSIDEGHQDLTPFDIEHILKMTSDVTLKIKIPNEKLIV